VFTVCIVGIILEIAYKALQRQGLAASVGNATYDLNVGPVTGVFDSAEKGLSTLADIQNVRFRPWRI